jgi:hypothetical protein
MSHHEEDAAHFNEPPKNTYDPNDGIRIYFTFNNIIPKNRSFVMIANDENTVEDIITTIKNYITRNKLVNGDPKIELEVVNDDKSKQMLNVRDIRPLTLLLSGLRPRHFLPQGCILEILVSIATAKGGKSNKNKRIRRKSVKRTNKKC